MNPQEKINRIMELDRKPLSLERQKKFAEINALREEIIRLDKLLEKDDSEIQTLLAQINISDIKAEQ